MCLTLQHRPFVPRTLLAVVAFFGLLAFSAPTSAQTPIDVVRASSLYSKALASYRAGNMPAALAHLKQSEANLKGKTNADLEFLKILIYYRMENYAEAYRLIVPFFEAPPWKDKLQSYRNVDTYRKGSKKTYNEILTDIFVELEKWANKQKNANPNDTAQKLANIAESKLRGIATNLRVHGHDSAKKNSSAHSTTSICGQTVGCRGYSCKVYIKQIFESSASATGRFDEEEYSRSKGGRSFRHRIFITALHNEKVRMWAGGKFCKKEGTSKSSKVIYVGAKITPQGIELLTFSTPWQRIRMGTKPVTVMRAERDSTHKRVNGQLSRKLSSELNKYRVLHRFTKEEELAYKKDPRGLAKAFEKALLNKR